MSTVRHIFPALTGILWSVALGAQSPSGTITGRVIDSSTQQPLTGVTVLVEGTRLGTVTGNDGVFRLGGVPEGNRDVRARRIGYQSQLRSVAVGAGATANVEFALAPSASFLDQVVVVGYSSQRKSDITGAVATVAVEGLESLRVADVAQALQGQVAGVQITQSTGAPGEEISIRIRGEGTIGNNSPLFIVDGVPTRDISFLNPADIQALSVLKDAAAASIYGSRASAGVIVIATKGGTVGQSSIDLNYYSGIQQATNLPDMLNASQYMDKVEEAWNNSGFTGTNPYTLDKARTDLANTDWLDELFEAGRTQSVDLTARGGTERIRYLLSGGFQQQDGIVVYDNDTYQRLN